MCSDDREISSLIKSTFNVIVRYLHDLSATHSGGSYLTFFVNFLNVFDRVINNIDKGGYKIYS